MLTKSKNKNIFGVCGGLAEYFNLDPTLIRILFVLGAILSGSVIFWLYLILAIVLPTSKD